MNLPLYRGLDHMTRKKTTASLGFLFNTNKTDKLTVTNLSFREFKWLIVRIQEKRVSFLMISFTAALGGNSLEIDFVYLKSCLEDPRRQYSASQQVLEDGEGTRGC